MNLTVRRIVFWGGLLGLCLFSEVAVAGWSGSQKWKGYGNWCGLGGRGRAIDALDAACKAHDRCFERYGKLKTKEPFATYGHCGCDAKFLRRLGVVLPVLKKQYSSSKTAYKKAYRHYLFIKKFYKIQKCVKRRQRVCKFRSRAETRKNMICNENFGSRQCRTVKYQELAKRRTCQMELIWGRGGR